jgi:hypothetical protein
MSALALHHDLAIIISSFHPIDMTSSEAIYISLILIFLTLCYTRSTTGARSRELAGTNAQGAEEISYWFPWLGHSLSLLTDPDRFIRETRFVPGVNSNSMALMSNQPAVVDPEHILATDLQLEVEHCS